MTSDAARPAVLASPGLWVPEAYAAALYEALRTRPEPELRQLRDAAYRLAMDRTQRLIGRSAAGTTAAGPVPQAGERWVTVADAAQLLGVGERRVRQLIELGKLTARKPGNVYEVALASVERRRECMAADVQPERAFAVGGFGASGQTSQFDMPPGPVFVASVVTGVAGTSPSLSVFLDVNQDGNWVQVAALTAQTGAGVQSANAAGVPPDASSTYRLRWTVSGTGAEIFGRVFAAGVMA